MAPSQDLDGYVVVGATLVAPKEELPIRLRAILQYRGISDTYFLQYESTEIDEPTADDDTMEVPKEEVPASTPSPPPPPPPRRVDTGEFPRLGAQLVDDLWEPDSADVEDDVTQEAALADFPLEDDATEVAPKNGIQDDEDTFIGVGRGAEQISYSLVPRGESVIEQRVSSGQYQLFPFSFSARSGYVLIQLQSDHPPEYVTEAQAKRRVREMGEYALQRAASALNNQDLDGAFSAARYAARAMPKDPIAILLVTALTRRVIQERGAHVLGNDQDPEGKTTLARLHSRLRYIGEDAVQTRFREIAFIAANRPITDCIRSDILAETYQLIPGWMMQYCSTSRRRPSSYWERGFG